MTPDAPLLSVIVPIRDEAELLPSLHRSILDACAALPCRLEIVFVENGSRDDSLAILRRLPNVTVVVLATSRERQHQTDALAAGIDHSTGSLLASLDADQNPADLRRLFANMGDADAVIGRRVGRAKGLGITAFVSRAGNLLRHLLGLSTVHDAGCGMRVWKSVCTETLPLYAEWSRFFPDLLALHGWKVTETDIPYTKRTVGYSKYRWTKCFRSFFDALGLWFRRRYGDRPLQGFSFLSVAAFIGIFALTAASLLLASSHPVIAALLGALAAAKAVSVLLFALGLSADLSLASQKRRRGYVLREVIRTGNAV